MRTAYIPRTAYILKDTSSKTGMCYKVTSQPLQLTSTQSLVGSTTLSKGERITREVWRRADRQFK